MICRRNRKYRPEITKPFPVQKTAQEVRRKKARKRRIRFYRLMAIIRIILCLIGAHTVADTIYGWVHKPPEKEEAVVQVVSLPAQNDEIAFEEHDITLRNNIWR